MMNKFKVFLVDKIILFKLKCEQTYSQKIWMKVEEIGKLQPQNNLCSPEKYRKDSKTVQGTQYGWNIKLLPVSFYYIYFNYFVML